MSLRFKTSLLVAALAFAILCAGLAVDVFLVGPWAETLLPDPDAGQLKALLWGATARRVALIWVVLSGALFTARVLDSQLTQPVTALTAAVTEARVRQKMGNVIQCDRQDELGAIAREFGHVQAELTAMHDMAHRSAAYTSVLEEKLGAFDQLEKAVGHLGQSAQRLGLALAADDQLLDEAASLTAEVAALGALVHSINSAADSAPESPSDSAADVALDSASDSANKLADDSAAGLPLSSALESALESPAKSVGLTTDRLAEVEPC